MTPAAAFTRLALDYFERHGIDPELARELGVGEVAHALTYRYEDRLGEYRRRRPLDGDRTLQPQGRELSLWWPAGRPAVGADVLICEGEPDALAALTALASLNGAAPVDVPTVTAVPGTAMPEDRVVTELREAGVPVAYVAMDGDEAGRKAAARFVARLRDAAIEPIVVELPDGQDLADVLVRAGDAGQALAGLLADSYAATEDETPLSEPGTPTSWAPIPLEAILAGEDTSTPPALLARVDGHCLLYADNVHDLHGEPEACKGWIALAACAERLHAGENALYIDFEDSAPSIVRRLRDLGVAPAAIAAHFTYLRPDEGPEPEPPRVAGRHSTGAAR